MDNTNGKRLSKPKLIPFLPPRQLHSPPDGLEPGTVPSWTFHPYNTSSSPSLQRIGPIPSIESPQAFKNLRLVSPTTPETKPSTSSSSSSLSTHEHFMRTCSQDNYNVGKLKIEPLGQVNDQFI